MRSEILVRGVARVLRNKERWEELCELASKEQDPQKVLELIKEINRLLDAKLDRANPLAIQINEYHNPDVSKA